MLAGMQVRESVRGETLPLSDILWSYAAFHIYDCDLGYAQWGCDYEHECTDRRTICYAETV